KRSRNLKDSKPSVSKTMRPIRLKTKPQRPKLQSKRLQIQTSSITRNIFLKIKKKKAFHFRKASLFISYSQFCRQHTWYFRAKAAPRDILCNGDQRFYRY